MAMRGILKPAPTSTRDPYSQITSIGGGYDGSMQYQHQQHQQQHPQTEAWPGVVNTSHYYPAVAPYATPSGQPYATRTQPASASQPVNYGAYNPASNTYTYPSQSPTAAQGHNGGLSEEPITPGSGQKGNRTVYGRQHEAHADDLDELCALLQAEIDANFVNDTHELTKSEISLSLNAFVPLLRPHIGPYAEGGDQDLPEEFKQNWTEEIAAAGKAGDEGQEDSQTQEQSQDMPQDGSQEAEQSPSQEVSQDASQSVSNNRSQPDGDTSPSQPPPGNNPDPEQQQETPSEKPAPKKPEDPLKKCPNATVSCILNIKDANIRSIIQRAASRGIVQRITKMDGFKYMFNNFWTSHVDNDGMRFSYTCRDSLQNKDRAAHVPARATTNPPVHSRAMMRVGKPSWDCKGSVSVKFSLNAGAIVVQYRHAAIHPRHADHKKAPRKSRAKLGGRGIGRPRGSGTKRKRDADSGYQRLEPSIPTPTQFPSGSGELLPPPLPQLQTNREPSLFELLQQSAIETAASNSGGQLGSTSSPWWANS